MVSKSYSITSKAKPECGVFCNKFRFFILLLGTFCMSAIFSNMITLNFTIICMGSQAKKLNFDIENITQVIFYEYLPRLNDWRGHPNKRQLFEWEILKNYVLKTHTFSNTCLHLHVEHCSAVFGSLLRYPFNRRLEKYIFIVLKTGFLTGTQFYLK